MDFLQVSTLIISVACVTSGAKADSSKVDGHVSVSDSCLPLLDAPVIGILAQESPGRFRKYGDQYVFASYVKYLELAGARVVIVRGHQTDQYYQDMFHMLNGVLLPGGHVDVVTSEATRVAGIFYRLALEAFDRGDYFPIWGTCQGFEQMTVLTSGKNLLSRTDSHDLTMPLDLTDEWKHSRLLGSAPSDVIKSLQTENVTANFHDWSLVTKTFHTTESLSSFYRVLSTNWDKRKGSNFVSTFEGIRYPVYGVQWHPEMNIFAWQSGISVKHTPSAIRVAQYFANFFVDEARKNSHRSFSYQQIAASLAENERVFYSQSDMRQIYAHNLTET